jgi:hypothetical protein
MTPNQRSKPDFIRRSEYVAGRLRASIADLRQHPLIFQGDHVRVAANAFVQAPASNDNSGENPK